MKFLPLGTKPLVSVLMTVYNSAHTIKKAIDSLIAQTYDHWELIIVDDGSSDGLEQTMASITDERVKIFYNEQNIGYVPCKNILLDKINGELACILDADDWLREDRIEAQLKIFRDYPGTAACMCSYMKVYPDGEETPVRYFNESKFLNIYKDDIGFPGGGMMFRKEVVDEIGKFDLFFHRIFGDDSYWAFKIAEKLPFYYLDDTLYYYSANPLSITVNFENIDKLTMSDLLAKLKQQRVKTGTDWLEEKKFEEIEKYKAGLLSNKRWLSDKYREIAAVRLDMNDTRTARTMISKAIKTAPQNITNYRTAMYYIKKVLRKKD